MCIVTGTETIVLQMHVLTHGQESACEHMDANSKSRIVSVCGMKSTDTEFLSFYTV